MGADHKSPTRLQYDSRGNLLSCGPSHVTDRYDVKVLSLDCDKPIHRGTIVLDGEPVRWSYGKGPSPSLRIKYPAWRQRPDAPDIRCRIYDACREARRLEEEKLIKQWNLEEADILEINRQQWGSEQDSCEVS